MLELHYDCDRVRLGSRLAARFRPLTRDQETEAWLREHARPHGYLATKLMAAFGRFLSSYEVHGLFGAYPMHLLSRAALRDLLGEPVPSWLDAGAGAGYVTECARELAGEVVCTETAPRLVRRLRDRGFVAHEIDLGKRSLERRFDVVSCFNVLDRTARPLTLLDALLGHLAERGRLVISIPLPPSPHVHVAGATVAPTERLPSAAADWETAARELSERLFESRGLSILRLARVPYLSRGDAYAPLYALDAAVWLLQRAH